MNNRDTVTTIPAILPSPLPDMRRNKLDWQVIQGILNLNVKLADKTVAAEIPTSYICPVTRSFMYAPMIVWYLDKKIWIENDALQSLQLQIRLGVRSAKGLKDVQTLSNDLCLKFPHLKKICDLVDYLFNDE